jgi:trehalose/maltose hydrolase-like predicted phosphorylase
VERAEPSGPWTVEIEGVDSGREPARAAVLTLADGVVGTRAAVPGEKDAGEVVAAGLYEGTGPETALIPLPSWNGSPLAGLTAAKRVLDLRDGTLRAELESDDGPASTMAFASLARPGTVVLTAEPEGGGAPLQVVRGTEHGKEGGRSWARVSGSGGAAVAASQRVAGGPAGRARLERLAAYATDPHHAPSAEAALELLEEAERLGVDALLQEQRSAWTRRWAAADIRIEGDDDLQRAVRFCLFHLMASVADRPEAALGAKGLSGRGYRGHVFWDTDVFVLPFLAATHPPAARALVGYRVARLDAARAEAARHGHAGARFPWESADQGVDITPTELPGPDGLPMAVRTGQQEEHITADVAWAVARYLAWSGERDDVGGCYTLLGETARYWASRVRRDEDGTAHIDGVIGPDEYHELIDDNAFTNAMVARNLRIAAALAPSSAHEAGLWRRVADELVIGYDPDTGRHEQFAGFFALESPTLSNLPPGADPVAVLGWKHLQRTQLIKQADVLMLHLLVPELAAPGSLEPDIDWYEPRTTHASSLSAPVHAAALARAGRLDGALRYLHQAATIDLDDRVGNTRDGLHIASMGGVWHALIHGIAGLELRGPHLRVHPNLPPGWDAFEFQVLVHGAPFRFRVLPDRVIVRTARARAVRVGEQERWVEAGPDGMELEHDARAWRDGR